MQWRKKYIAEIENEVSILLPKKQIQAIIFFHKLLEAWARSKKFGSRYNSFHPVQVKLTNTNICNSVFAFTGVVK